MQMQTNKTAKMGTANKTAKVDPRKDKAMSLSRSWTLKPCGTDTKETATWEQDRKWRLQLNPETVNQLVPGFCNKRQTPEVRDFKGWWPCFNCLLDPEINQLRKQNKTKQNLDSITNVHVLVANF